MPPLFIAKAKHKIELPARDVFIREETLVEVDVDDEPPSPSRLSGQWQIESSPQNPIKVIRKSAINAVIRISTYPKMKPSLREEPDLRRDMLDFRSQGIVGGRPSGCCDSNSGLAG
jgi:hypothetical protein